MGKREGSPWDVLSGPGVVLAQLCGLFLAGGVAACLYVGFAAEEGALTLRDYLVDYLTLVGGGGMSHTFWLLLWDELRWLLAVLLMCFTVLGSVGLPALFFVRGFLFSFSVGCFCRVFGWVGLVPGLVLFGLPALMWVPAFFLTGTQGLSAVRRLKTRGKGESCSRLEPNSVFWMRFLLSLLLLLVCGGVEYLLVPALLRAAAHIVL